MKSSKFCRTLPPPRELWISYKGASRVGRRVFGGFCDQRDWLPEVQRCEGAAVNKATRGLLAKAARSSNHACIFHTGSLKLVGLHNILMRRNLAV